MATINLADGITGVGQIIGGAGTGDYLGQSVSGGGDVNGDGIPDLILGTYLLDGGAPNSGGAYVVFGGDTTFDSAVDVVTGLGTTSIRLRGEATSDGAGAGVSVVGDVNNDGIDDILIGAPGNGGKGAGYVVFGSASLATNIDLGSLGSDGFKVTGAYTGDSVGAAVAIIGDVDNDGIDDLVLGAPGGDYAGFNYGGAFVIYGDGSLGADITLPASSVNMYAEGDTYAGRGVRGFGDVNDDGIEDFIIGSDGTSTAGRSYVVFGTGSPFSSPFALDNLTATDGFDILGEAAGDAAGAGNVAIIGDINGDGVADIGVGAPGSDTGGTDAGAAYLIFGGSGLGADIALGSLGAGGIKIVGENADDEFGDDIRSAGDFNGDGIDDVLIVAGAYGNGLGAVYIIFGQSNLADDEGGKVVGNTGDGLAQAAGVGDVNNDGLADILIGAPTADDGSADTGRAYVIFGFAQIDGGAGGDSLTGGDAADSLTGNAGNDTLIGNGGNDTLDGGLNDDSLDGGSGDDSLISGTGNDSLFGGAGTDTAVVSFGEANEFQVRLLTGTQLNGLLTIPDPGDGFSRQAVFTGAAVRMQFTGGEAGFQLLASDIEKVQFGDGTVDLSDIVDLDLADLGIEELYVGGAGDNVVTGEASDDIMAAGGGNDTVNGAGGNDRAYGQAGDDSVIGGVGNDSLFGNLGNDTVVGGAGDDSLKAQTNDDMLMGEAGNDVAFGGGNNDMIDGGADSDTLNGNSGFDTLIGGDGNDTLRGQGGRDSLNGGAGNDLLLGMQGFDTLVGGDGNDTLIGGPADDLLTGGAGVDIFTFGSGQGSNTITDFADGTDMILMQGIAFADLNFANSGDDTVITVDGDDLSVTVNGISANQLTAADFV